MESKAQFDASSALIFLMAFIVFTTWLVSKYPEWFQDIVDYHINSRFGLAIRVPFTAKDRYNIRMTEMQPLNFDSHKYSTIDDLKDKPTTSEKVSLFLKTHHDQIKKLAVASKKRLKQSGEAVVASIAATASEVH